MKYAYAFSKDGLTCYEAHSGYKDVPLKSFEINYPGCVVVVFDDIQHRKVPKEFLMLVGSTVQVKPGWSESEEPPNPIEELRDLVRNNIMASEHDKKWLLQKETLKVLAISWIKANPTATQLEFQTAVFAALALEFPNDPIVINPEGMIVSYAVAAKNRNLIAEPTFVALRDLIVATSEKNLNKLLAKL